MIAADTSRTRAYLAALERNRLLPSWALLLEAGNKAMPGQTRGGAPRPPATADWPEADFDPSRPLRPWLDRLGVNYVVADTADINAPLVVDLIAGCEPEVLVYSGYGGVLLRNAMLSAGKRFLHVHGGYLPDFKGSTTNYFSILTERSFGASAIFLTAEIDGGPLLCRRHFPLPPDRRQIDHVYDSAARASVLVETLRAWRQKGAWPSDLPANRGGRTYYVIHPVLKHIAILGDA